MNIDIFSTHYFFGQEMFFLLITLMTASFAQEESDESIEKAKQAYKYGEQLFNEGNYPEAIKAFLRAYELTQRYQLLYNLALSYQFSADLERAKFYFEEYQRLAPAEQWNEAQQRIDNIDAILEQKKQNDNQENVEDVVSVEPVQNRIPKWASPVMWGVGTVGVASGLYFGMKSQSDGNLATGYCRDNLCSDQASVYFSSAQTSAILADIAWGVGLTSLGGALWLQINKDSAISCSPSTFAFRGVF